MIGELEKVELSKQSALEQVMSDVAHKWLEVAPQCSATLSCKTVLRDNECFVGVGVGGKKQLSFANNPLADVQ